METIFVFGFYTVKIFTFKSLLTACPTRIFPLIKSLTSFCTILNSIPGKINVNFMRNTKFALKKKKNF